MNVRLRMYQVLLFKFRRHLCKGSIVRCLFFLILALTMHKTQYVIIYFTETIRLSWNGSVMALYKHSA